MFKNWEVKMRMRRTLAIFMAVAMVFCYIPNTEFSDVAAAETTKVEAETTSVVDSTENRESLFVDMPKEGLWSTAAIKLAVSNGLLNGFVEKGETYIRPNDSLTRAQMATIVNRAFGAQETATLSGVADVSKNAWYYKDMQKALKMGTMKLDNKMRPNDSITRQEAFTILGRALKMEGGTNADLAKFNDASSVASWATSGMGAMVKAGYINGDDNMLTPTDSMTRAQFATIMNNVIKEYISNAGTFTELSSGNVTVNVPGVTLKDATITGDLIVGDGVGDGNLTLNNVVVKGNLIIRGGGVDSIIITGGSVNGKVIIAKIDGKVRVFAQDGAEIEVVEIIDGKDHVIIEGIVGIVEISSQNTPVIIRNANVKTIEVKTQGAGNITIADTSKVNNIVVGASSTGTKISVAGTVTNLETSAQDTNISGAGTVTNAKINNGANGTSITTPNTKIDNKAEGVTH